MTNDCEGKRLMAALDQRLDGIQASITRVETRQTTAHNDAMDLRHRVDMLEKDMRHSDDTNAMSYKILAESMDRNHKLTARLFERFDTHCATEDSDRKRLLFWLITSGVGLVGGVILMLFNKVFS